MHEWRCLRKRQLEFSGPARRLGERQSTLPATVKFSSGCSFLRQCGLFACFHQQRAAFDLRVAVATRFSWQQLWLWDAQLPERSFSTFLRPSVLQEAQRCGEHCGASEFFAPIFVQPTLWTRGYGRRRADGKSGTLARGVARTPQTSAKACAAMAVLKVQGLSEGPCAVTAKLITAHAVFASLELARLTAPTLPLCARLCDSSSMLEPSARRSHPRSALGMAAEGRGLVVGAGLAIACVDQGC